MNKNRRQAFGHSIYKAATVHLYDRTATAGARAMMAKNNMFSRQSPDPESMNQTGKRTKKASIVDAAVVTSISLR